MNCTIFLESSVINYNITRQNWLDEEYTKDMTSEDYIFNTTYWISYDLAPSSRYCTMGTLEMYTWFLFKKTQFDSFGDVFAAWL